MAATRKPAADQAAEDRAAARRRSSAARIASHSSWAQTDDPSSRTRPAREAFMRRFEAEVDPDGVLSPEVRARKADSAMRAYMGRLAKSRQRKAADGPGK